MKLLPFCSNVLGIGPIVGMMGSISAHGGGGGWGWGGLQALVETSPRSVEYTCCSSSKYIYSFIYLGSPVSLIQAFAEVDPTVVPRMK